MKLENKLFACLLFAIPIPLAANAAPPVTVELTVPAMKCAGCAWSVTEKLKKLDGVSAVFVDPKSKKALIEVTSEAIPGKSSVYAAVKETGYAGKKYHVVSETFSTAKAHLTK